MLSEYVPFKHFIADCISLNGHLNPLVQLLHLVSPVLEYVPRVHSTGDTDLLRQLSKRNFTFRVILQIVLSYCTTVHLQMYEFFLLQLLLFHGP